jgi:glycosyltransferase involved in cell wall biosynthesis
MAESGEDGRVTIGLPTYNRAATLRRAIESALGQTHAALELVVSDNASTDATEQIVRDYARRDARVRYVRHAVNRGPTANFNFLFEACRGDFVMMLADDDWLDADYVAVCLAALRQRPDHAIVGGLHRWMDEGRPAGDGVAMILEHDDPGRRVVDYYRQVDDNGSFYGLMRGDALRAAGPMRNDLGNDWFHVAAIAFQGKVHTLAQVRVNRAIAGTSHSIDDILSTFGVHSSTRARLGFLFMAGHAFSEIAWRSPAFSVLSRPSRLALALRAAPRVIRWRILAWHLVRPTLLGLRRRRRARRLIDRLVRRAGGTIR